MKNGWIKLHRKVLGNKIFNFDKTAWNIFEFLLLDCDDGKWSGGRFQLAKLCGFKPTTTYRALQRLKNAKMVTLKSNNKYTDIYICNWNKYQLRDDSVNDNKVTTKCQQSDTLYRIKNKELRNINTIGIAELQKKFPTKDVKQEYEKAKDYLASTGRRYKDYHAFFRNWLRRAKDVKNPQKLWKPPEIEPLDEEKKKRIDKMKQEISNKLKWEAK
jgi:hypothetical protein